MAWSRVYKVLVHPYVFVRPADKYDYLRRIIREGVEISATYNIKVT